MTSQHPPSAAPAGVCSPALFSLLNILRRAEKAEQRKHARLGHDLQPRRHNLGAHNLGRHSLHGGLQVPEQVRALVEEGDLGVDQGEHLETQTGGLR